METPWYLVGEPVLRVGKKSEFPVSLSQVALCQKVLQETSEEQTILQRLQEEYLAIVFAMKQMGLELRIIIAHKNAVDQQVDKACRLLNCRFASIPPEYFIGAVAYPRDFAVMLPGVLLVNAFVAKFSVSEKGGYKLISSLLGEGGRLLNQGNFVLVSERLCIRDGQSQDPEHLDELAAHGIQSALFPPPLFSYITTSGIVGQSSFNDHIDRVASLLRGKDGSLHLVVDPGIQCIRWFGRKKAILWEPLLHEETVDLIQERCAPLGIQVQVPPEMMVPCALNLIQFHDGRVLMTSGDDSVAEIVSAIVGKENVFFTEVPIRYFPVWKYAGIRCLVCEAPTPIFKKLSRPKIV